MWHVLVETGHIYIIIEGLSRLFCDPFENMKGCLRLLAEYRLVVEQLVAR